MKENSVCLWYEVCLYSARLWITAELSGLLASFRTELLRSMVSVFVRNVIAGLGYGHRTWIPNLIASCRTCSHCRLKVGSGNVFLSHFSPP